MGNEEQENYTSYQSMPNQDSSFMRYRLDTSELIKQLKITLSGQIEEVYEVDGDLKSVVKNVGVPLVNPRGLNYIINWFKGIVNSQTVQGNLTLEEYSNLIATFREQISKFVFINFNNWEIEEWAYEPIIDCVMNTIKLFLTRPINNKERDSFNNGFKETFINNPNQRRLKWM